MTAEALEYTATINENIKRLPEAYLKKVSEFTNRLMTLFTLGIETDTAESLSHQQTKKVLYNGKLYNEKTVKFLSRKVNHDTDEEVEEQIRKYIQEKYK